MRNRIFLICSVFVVLTALACGSKKAEPETFQNATASIEFKNRGVVVFKLYPDKAPNITKQFIKLARDSFYNGLQVWRISTPGIIQSGCPNNDGTGHSGKLFKEEIDTTLHHKRGTLSMINFGKPLTTSSQFIICKKDCSELDGKYTIIGQAIAGLNVLDSIEKFDTVLSVTIKEGD